MVGNGGSTAILFSWVPHVKQNKSAFIPPRPRSTLSVNFHYLPNQQSFFRGSTHNDVRWINGFWRYKAFGHGFRHIPSSEKTNLLLEFTRHLDSPSSHLVQPQVSQDWNELVEKVLQISLVIIMNRYLPDCFELGYRRLSINRPAR